MTIPHRLLTIATLAVATTTAPVTQSGTAVAGTPHVQARYGNTTIDLKQGWSTARSCVVTRAQTTCYASNAEADAAIGATPTASLAIPACASGWLCLYQEINGGGRRLIFQSEGWQSLVPYGFDHQTSSWRNNQACSDAAILGDGGGGVLNLGNCAYGASMGSWNERAVDVGA
jgi:hypothetical protein